MGIEQYINQSHDVRYKFFNLALRLVTGLLLLLKGIYFVSHSQHLETIIMASDARSAVTFLVGYISFAHLFGGAFIMLGLLTRFAVILQIPILIGAMLYNLTSNAFEPVANFYYRLLCLCFSFMFYYMEAVGFQWTII
jgi:uncharacterized membrane protein YphA (DoxX/SURF4 family)